MDNCFLLGNQSSGRPNNANAGSWSLEENLSYTIFIDIHKKSMTSKKKMREMQFYDKLSAFVGTRTSSQCRSHHQKLFAKFKFISKIRELFRGEVGLQNYKSRFRDGLQKMQEINRAFTATSLNNDLESAPDDLNQVQEAHNGPTGVDLPQIVPFGNPLVAVLGYGWPHLSMMEGLGFMWLNGGVGHLNGGGYPS